jgi:NADH-quinone oxidoreductase subunit D
MAVGARLTCHGFRIGGVMRDLPEEFAPACRAFLREMPRRLDENDRLLTGNPIFRARTEGVGVISGERATAWGLSGPSLRGSGVALDWRRVTPYAGYDRVEFDVATADSGDCWGRYLVRIEEMRQSLRIIRQCLNALPEGPVQAKVPRILRPPAGEARCHIEAPRGDLGFYLVSDGSVNPYRLRVRGPSFVNLGALTEMCRGLKVADVVAILGSIDVVLGEIDR